MGRLGDGARARLLQLAWTTAKLGCIAVIAARQSLQALTWGPVLHTIIRSAVDVKSGRLSGASRLKALALAVATAGHRSCFAWSFTQLPLGGALGLALLDAPLSMLIQLAVQAPDGPCDGDITGGLLQLLAVSLAIGSGGRLNRASLAYGLVALVLRLTVEKVDHYGPEGYTAMTTGSCEVEQKDAQPTVLARLSIAATAILTATAFSFSTGCWKQFSLQGLAMAKVYAILAVLTDRAMPSRLNVVKGEADDEDESTDKTGSEHGVAPARESHAIVAAATSIVAGAAALYWRLKADRWQYQAIVCAATAGAGVVILTIDYVLERGFDREGTAKHVSRRSQGLSRAVLAFLVTAVCAHIAWTLSPWYAQRPLWDERLAGDVAAASLLSWRNARSNDNVPQIDIVVAHFKEPLEELAHTVAELRNAVSAYPNVRVIVCDKGLEMAPTVNASQPASVDVVWQEQRHQDIAERLAAGADRVEVLENVGREGATYLDYIIEHYDNLPHQVICIQASPDFGSTYHPRLKLIGPDVGFLSFGWYLTLKDGWDSKGNGHYEMDVIWNIFHDTTLDPYPRDREILATYGGAWLVSRRRILRRSKASYEKLRYILTSDADDPQHVGGFGYKGQEEGPLNPYLGHVLERSWPMIFGAVDPAPAHTLMEGAGADGASTVYP